MTSPTTMAISDAIYARIFDHHKPVTARWICYEHMCNMHTAQTLLQQLSVDKPGSVTVTRLIEGEFKNSGQRKVSMVSEAKAQELRDSMSRLISDQIYGIAPVKGDADPTSLISADVEQARVMMTALLSTAGTDQARAFAGNGCSMVRGPPCPRKRGPAPSAAASLPPKPKAQSAPSRAATQPAKAPGAASAKASVASDKASGAACDIPTAHPRAATVAAVAVKPGNGQNEETRKAGSKSAAAGPAAKKGGALAASFGKAPPKKPKPEAAVVPKEELAVKPEVETPTQPVPENAEPTAVKPTTKRKGKAQILDSDDEEEKRSSSESPLLSRPLQSKRPAQIIEDDSDDDFAAPVKPTGKAASTCEAKTNVNKKAAKKQKPAPAKARNSQAEEQPAHPAVVAPEPEEPDSDPPAPQPAAAVDVMSDRSNHQAASAREHPEYGMPPHPDAEIKMVGSKAFWEYIDDKGAEVSVVATVKGAKAAAVKQEPHAKRSQPDTQPPGAAASDKPAKKKKLAVKNAKAAVGAADIRSMFGRK